MIRKAELHDVLAICRFGEAHVRAHYAPLLGKDAADEQVRDWWSPGGLRTAVGAGVVLIAETEGEVIGVGQRGRRGSDHVIYKLYVHPEHRGTGLGRRLLGELIRDLPVGADRLYIEHFVSNQRAGEFYEREGFAVQRIEPSPTGNLSLGIVWRVRELSESGPGAIE